MRDHDEKIIIIFSLLTVLTLPVFAQQQPADPDRTPGIQAGPDPARTAWVNQYCSDPAMPEPRTRRGGELYNRRIGQ